MSALAVNAAVAAPAPATAAAPATGAGAEGSGFAALLGEMASPKSAAAEPQANSTVKEKHDPAPARASDASTLTALQSLEAALNGLGALGSAAARPDRGAAPSGSAETAAGAAPIGSALAAAAGAIDAAAWDASGKTPLKSLLQSDPSLGLSDFQMKTFLAAAGATPAKAGAIALGPEAAWSPLALAKPGADGTTAQGAQARARLRADGHGAARAQDARDSHAGQPAAAAAVSGGVSAAASPGAADGGGAQRGGGDALTKSSDAGAVAPAAAPAGDASTPAFSVPLANLPAFIADQASALATDASAASDAAASSPAAAAAAPKAAQAVKELQITLDPADLGQMTLKLRLADGKLSVTIAVANPKTLTSIEDDRALIAARLGAGDQTLGDLVIQRQAGAPATQETKSSHVSFSDSSAEASSTDSEAGASNLGRRSSRGFRGGARAGGALGDLVV
jgi:hypothetical protein